MRTVAGMIFGVSLVGAVVVSAGVCADATAEPLPRVAGKAQVIDGDEIVIAGRHIRLFGIDAPDVDQTCTGRKGDVAYCGRLAAQALAKLTGGGQPLACNVVARAAGGRLLADCAIGPFDVNEQMVLDGWALADPADGAAYARAEAFAKARKEGLWRMTFMPPWEWRAKRKADQ